MEQTPTDNALSKAGELQFKYISLKLVVDPLRPTLIDTTGDMAPNLAQKMR